MKNVIHTLLSVALIFSIAGIVFARGAPIKQKAFTQAAVSAEVAPIVASVPPMTVGYDVICNITEDAVIRAGNAQSVDTDTSETSRLSATGDWRSIRSSGLDTTFRQVPALVLLA